MGISPLNLLSGGLSSLAGSQPTGGGGAGGGFDPNAATPANDPNNINTDPTVVAPAAVTAGDPTGQGRQEPADQQQSPTFTKTQDQLPGGGVNWTSPSNLGVGGGPPPAQDFGGGFGGGQTDQPPGPTGISPETSTGLSPQAEAAAGWNQPAAAQGQGGDQAEGQGADQSAVGMSAARDDSQQGQQSQQKQQSPLGRIANFLKNLEKPGSAPHAMPNLLQGLQSLLTGGQQGMEGMVKQAGRDFRPEPYSSQGYNQSGYGYGNTQPPAAPPGTPSGAAPGAPQTATPAAAPGSAAEAVRQGYDQAAAGEPRAQGNAPLVLADPSDPSKGYIHDPNAAGPSGGPPHDGVTPGNPQASANYIAQNGGFSEVGYGRNRGTYGSFKINPEMTNRLAAAGQEFERQTGQKPVYGLGDRDSETQRFFWDESQHGTLYAAAPPGQSLHQRGLAMDMPPKSGFTAWLKAGNAERFGLGFPLTDAKRPDPYHIQMQDAHGRAYPYAPNPMEAGRPATGQQSSLEAGGGTIPGSQSPAGTRPGDPNYNPRAYAQATFNIESGGNPNARTGSNRGLGQFGPAEEREFGITAWNRRDPQAQERALQLETQRNSNILRGQLGRDPTPAELYLTHQQGQAGGPALLRADPNTPAWQAISHYYRSPAIAQRAITGNLPKNDPLRAKGANITAGEFVNWWKDRYNRETAPQQPAETSGAIQLPQQLAQNTIRPAIGRLAAQRPPAPEPPSRRFNQPFTHGRREWWQEQRSNEDSGNVSGGIRN